MESQIEGAAEHARPVFFYNLGDVIYFNGSPASSMLMILAIVDAV
jgi:hypothetical protein